MKKLVVVSVAHFCADLCCAALFYGRLGNETNWWLCMVLYNACAFGMQLPLGFIADRMDRNLPFAAAGCALVALGFLPMPSPALAAICSGLGNGMFHVGAGIEVLNSSDKAAPLGVFVSPGAVGLYIGTVCAPFLIRYGWPLPVGMLLVGLGLLCLNKLDHPSQNAPLSLSMDRSVFLPLLCLFLVVVLRSVLSGEAFSTGQVNIPGVVPVLLLASGKAAGGFLGDRIGLRKTAVLSLGATALLMLMPRGYGTLLALFLFNMTMPLTLYEAACLLPGAKGAAFGLLTCALFVGVLPRFSGMTLSLPSSLWAILVMLSLGLLWIGLRKEKSHE